MMHSYCLLHYYALDSGHDEADFGNKPNQGKFDHLNLIMYARTYTKSSNVRICIYS